MSSAWQCIEAAGPNATFAFAGSPLRCSKDEYLQTEDFLWMLYNTKPFRFRVAYKHGGSDYIVRRVCTDVLVLEGDVYGMRDVAQPSHPMLRPLDMLIGADILFVFTLREGDVRRIDRDLIDAATNDLEIPIIEVDPSWNVRRVA